MMAPRGKRGRSDPRGDIIESLGLDEADFDERYDFHYDGSNGAVRECRGSEGRAFYWPSGWRKLALSVSGMYDRGHVMGCDHWLDRRHGWTVAFHGTVGDWRSIKDIVRHGFKVRGGASAPRNGERFGPGVYVTPDPEVAASYAEAVKFVTVLISDRESQLAGK